MKRGIFFSGNRCVVPPGLIIVISDDSPGGTTHRLIMIMYILPTNPGGMAPFYTKGNTTNLEITIGLYCTPHSLILCSITTPDLIRCINGFTMVSGMLSLSV